MSVNTKPLLSMYEWQQRGSCVGRDVESFFTEPAQRKLRRQRDAEAKALCAECPVRQECLRHALAVPENYGVWGATTPEERAAMRMPLAC